MSNEFTDVRIALFKSTFVWSPPDEVAAAISVASEIERHLYVERLGALYRWSLAHRGGPYPLLRISARFLGIDYQTIFIGYRTLPDGYAILSKDPDNFDEPDAWRVLEIGQQIAETAAESLLVSSLTSGEVS